MLHMHTMLVSFCKFFWFKAGTLHKSHIWAATATRHWFGHARHTTLD